ncbi:MrcB family domain-containing protein [Planococcus koreensis]|uniref:MrcB family domain-containing protein n=1 Tax=Planococcus koreensis TaxID=112331 RepID=UPI0039FD1055
MISNLFQKVFNSYADFYANPSTIRPDNMKRIIKYDIPQELISLLHLDPKKYLVTGSYGVGNPTETPWIAIFDRTITKSAQHGFYIVILFRKDMEGAYLSLNQGTTHLRNKFKGFRPIEKMKEVAKEIVSEVSLNTTENLVNEISLNSRQQNAKAYEAANIQAKYYEAYSFPHDEELATDINFMLNNLEKIRSYIGPRTLDQVIDELIYREEINDVQFQEDILVSPPAQTPIEPRLVPEKRSGGAIKEKFARDSKIAKEALVNAEYKCEVDPTHLTFISPITNHNFVEAHHLTPMSNQNNFRFSLDVPGNIVSLCPNCHREIHHGTETHKRILIKSLYTKRKEMLTQFGIDMEIDSIFKMYNI